MKSIITIFVAMCGVSLGDVCQHGIAVSQSPISVMGDHIHCKGEWMLSLRSMRMEMDGMHHGTNAVSPSQVHAANYVVSPESMTMDMHMLGLMMAPSDDLTLMVMLPYIQNEMDHVIQSGTPLINLNGGGNSFTTRSEGIGDLKFSALLRLADHDAHRLHAGIGLSLPTGSISERDLVPGPGGIKSRQLPATMQLGSGTVDLLPSLTYQWQGESVVAGVQARGVFRTHENHHEYQLGHRAEMDAWVSYEQESWLAWVGGVSFKWEGQLEDKQADVSQNPPFAPSRFTVPTAFGSNYGGMQLDGILGVNLIVPQGSSMEGHRLALDVRLPMWQDVNGYRLGTDLTTTLGWQFSF